MWKGSCLTAWKVSCLTAWTGIRLTTWTGIRLPTWTGSEKYSQQRSYRAFARPDKLTSERRYWLSPFVSAFFFPSVLHCLVLISSCEDRRGVLDGFIFCSCFVFHPQRTSRTGWVTGQQAQLYHLAFSLSCTYLFGCFSTAACFSGAGIWKGISGRTARPVEQHSSSRPRWPGARVRSLTVLHSSAA